MKIRVNSPFCQKQLLTGTLDRPCRILNNPPMPDIHQFNQLDDTAATNLILQCCSSTNWAARMIESRPYSTVEQLISTANSHWQVMEQADFLEAFQGHPKIGDPDSLRKKYASTHSMAKGEQSGVPGASDRVIDSLAQNNRDYEDKFGFIFIVCASGKSAEQMLDLIQARIGNNRVEEITNGAVEQRKITEIRIRKLFAW
jgi:2-oxo-4-hydroxy-4-carboxy-5-ureidoimidazoline decarboxylase